MSKDEDKALTLPEAAAAYKSLRESSAKAVFTNELLMTWADDEHPLPEDAHSNYLICAGWIYEGNGVWKKTERKAGLANAADVARGVVSSSTLREDSERMLAKREHDATNVYYAKNLNFPVYATTKHPVSAALLERGWRYNGEWIAPDVKPSAQHQSMQSKVEGLHHPLSPEAAEHYAKVRTAEVSAFQQEPIAHASDCAVHNAPAMPPGPCDCGANGMKDMRYEAVHALRDAGWVWTDEKWQAPPKAPSRTPAQLAAVKTLEKLRYEYTGGELWKPPVNNAYAGGHLGEMAAVPVLLGLGYTWANDEWQAPPEKPIDMKLWCPNCGAQHIDEPDDVAHASMDGSESKWTNPPHRSHLCHKCHCVWRVADVATNGVKETKTQGKRDQPTVEHVWANFPRSAQAVSQVVALGYEWDGQDWVGPRANQPQAPAARVDVNTLKGGEVFRTKDYGEVRFIGWDDYFGEQTAVIQSLEYGGRYNPKPYQLQAAVDALLVQPLPQPSRDATGAFHGLSPEQVADVVQELVDGVRRGEVKVESLGVRFDMEDRNNRTITIQYTACNPK